VQLEVLLGKLKKSMNSSGTERLTFQLVVQRLNQLRNRVGWRFSGNIPNQLNKYLNEWIFCHIDTVKLIFYINFAIFGIELYTIYTCKDTKFISFENEENLILYFSPSFQETKSSLHTIKI
jgi:hypothetical protein